MHAAIYARVSTGEQSTEQQVTSLREAAGRMLSSQRSWLKRQEAARGRTDQGFSG
jgi:DNA invertase Pin-like site-specific DNA recombinase